MAEYKVSWHIDISADSPEQAARIAHAIQRDRKSSATIFVVENENGILAEIDVSRNAQKESRK